MHSRSILNMHIHSADNVLMVKTNEIQKELRLQKWKRICDALDIPVKGKAMTDKVIEVTGVKQGSVSRWSNAKSRVDDKHIEAISKYTKYHYQWLMTGDGPMTISNNLSHSSVFRSTNERRLIKMWRRMNPACKYGVFSEAILARLTPDLYGEVGLSQEEFEMRADRKYSTLPDSDN